MEQNHTYQQSEIVPHCNSDYGESEKRQQKEVEKISEQFFKEIPREKAVFLYDDAIEPDVPEERH